MKSQWLEHAMLRAASWLAPGDRRGEWLGEWRAELWYVPRRGATRFCLGAFRDALWVRRNCANPARGGYLESPVRCLAVLAALAMASILVTVCLSGPLKLKPMYAHMGARDLPIGCLMTLAISCVLLPATGAAARTPGRHPMPVFSRLRRGVFLALKIVLVQPAMACGFVLWILIAPMAPFALFGILGACVLALRWVISDQRNRCPVCLRLLTSPVRIGTPAETFLEWYGAESVCSRGHGLLHASEISASYAGEPQWLHLDASWSGL